MSAGEERTRQLWLKLHAEFGEGLRASMRVAETTGREGHARDIDERLVQCIWFDQMLKAGELATASGKRVEVIEPGRWNTGPGPDFLGARLRIAGAEVGGDVEVHVQSAGWVQHSHHQDFEYNTVALHVCLHASDDRPYEEKQNGHRLERLVLAPVLDPDLETIRRTINVEDYPYGRPADVGLCHEQFLRLPAEKIAAFLRSAGRARIENKVARFRSQLASASIPQLVYQSLMTGQGFKAIKTLYFLLSKRAPYSELVDHAGDVAPSERADLFLSVLLHVAQLFPTQSDFFDGLDDESRALVAGLDRHWSTLRPYFRDRLMPPTRRWHSGMRPPGFPGRRLAAVAVLLQRFSDPDKPMFPRFCTHVRDHVPTTAEPKRWRTFFGDLTAMVEVEEPAHYFTRHYTLGGKPCKPQALLGEPAARSLVFNTFLPLGVLRARLDKDAELEKACWQAIDHHPSLAANSVTDFMKRRLFGDSGFDKGYFATELQQQALFKVFHDCCSSNERTCSDCTFLNAPFVPPA